MKSQKVSYPSSVWIALVCVYGVWGSTYLAIRFAIQTFPPFLMAGSRFIAAGLILYFFLRLRGVKAPKATEWKAATIAGFFLLVVGNGGVCWAEQKVPSGLTALLVGTVPLWIVLLEGRRGKKTLWNAWVGILLGLAGIGILTLMKPGPGEDSHPLWALMLVATSLSWAFGSLYARSAPLPSSALMATSMEMLTGGVMQMIVGFLLGEQKGFHPDQISGASFGAWIYLIFMGSLIGFTSYIWVLQKANPHLASTYAFVNPLIAVFLGWLIAGESLSLPVFLATVLIVSAVVLILRVGPDKAQEVK